MNDTNILAGRIAFTALNDSDVQRRLRNERFCFSGAVLWYPGTYCVENLIAQMRKMRDLGFNAVRFHNAEMIETSTGDYNFDRIDDWLNAANAADIAVILHPYTDILPGPVTLAEYDFDLQSFQDAYAENRRWQECARKWLKALVSHAAAHPSVIALGAAMEPSVGSGRLDNEVDKQQFLKWLSSSYSSLNELNRAWNIYAGAEGSHHETLIASTWEEALEILKGFDVNPQINGTHYAKLNYGAARDMLRFLTDKQVTKLLAYTDIMKEYAQGKPILTGSHLLGANQAAYLWDNVSAARCGDIYQTSIHLSWHFEGVGGEVDRPVYLQSRQTRDAFKGGFTSAYETTGGPVQYSGGFGNSMSAGLMRRLCLSYLAAGNLSMAFWTWNSRPGGWEAGEYGLTSLSGELTTWAVEAGKISKALQTYADELWTASQAAPVGILEDWDNQAILSLEPHRHDLVATRDGTGPSQQYNRSLMGISRALMNGKIPFELVSTSEARLSPDLLFRYKTIYVPHCRALSDDMLDILERYVLGGGRLVADVQFAFLDEHGKLRLRHRGNTLDRMFGSYVDAIHDARTGTKRINGADIKGFFGDFQLSTAYTLASFEDCTPSVTCNLHGEGTAIMIGFDAARMCHQPGQLQIESLLAQLCQSETPAWQCDCPLAFRLHTKIADHYFLINDGPKRCSFIKAFDAKYNMGLDVLTGRTFDANAAYTIELEAENAAWIRLERV